MNLSEKLESASAAAKRIKPYSHTEKDIKYNAKDLAEVIVFLDTVLPSYLADLKAVLGDIE